MWLPAFLDKSVVNHFALSALLVTLEVTIIISSSYMIPYLEPKNAEYYSQNSLLKYNQYSGANCIIPHGQQHLGRTMDRAAIRLEGL